eukprot:GDKI01000111.1.p2 GENE.GDKI01000111.1~~GDKI01000111.1.p2  ORF type:complete len:195 (-),score=81.05 GDKI01000111.1:308-832(-)
MSGAEENPKHREENKPRIAELFASDPSVCFLIERSKNGNVVVYNANVAADGKLDPKNPMGVYWINWSKGDKADKEELNMVERSMAYGLSSKKVDGKDNTYEVSLVALPARKVTVTQGADGKPVASIEINGKQARARQIYVYAVDNWVGLPTVKYVEISGEDESGASVTERVMNK